MAPAHAGFHRLAERGLKACGHVRNAGNVRKQTGCCANTNLVQQSDTAIGVQQRGQGIRNEHGQG